MESPDVHDYQASQRLLGVPATSSRFSFRDCFGGTRASPSYVGTSSSLEATAASGCSQMSGHVSAPVSVPVTLHVSAPMSMPVSVPVSVPVPVPKSRPRRNASNLQEGSPFLLRCSVQLQTKCQEQELSRRAVILVAK